MYTITVISTFGWELSTFHVTIIVSRGQESTALTPLILQPRRHHKVVHFTAPAINSCRSYNDMFALIMLDLCTVYAHIQIISQRNLFSDISA